MALNENNSYSLELPFGGLLNLHRYLNSNLTFVRHDHEVSKIKGKL